MVKLTTDTSRTHGQARPADHAYIATPVWPRDQGVAPGMPIETRANLDQETRIAEEDK